VIFGFKMADVIVNKNGYVMVSTPAQLILITPNKSEVVNHRE
jgi:hypothetical protein